MKLADILGGIFINAGIRLAANPHQKVTDALANAGLDAVKTGLANARGAGSPLPDKKNTRK